MTAFIYYHKRFSLSTIFQCFHKKFFEVFFKSSRISKCCVCFGLTPQFESAYCLRQLAYNNPLRFFCKAFFDVFCKLFDIFFGIQIIEHIVKNITDKMFFELFRQNIFKKAQFLHCQQTYQKQGVYNLSILQFRFDEHIQLKEIVAMSVSCFCTIHACTCTRACARTLIYMRVRHS